MVLECSCYYCIRPKQLKQGLQNLQELQKQFNEAKKLNTSFDGYMDDLRKKFDLANSLKKTLGVDIKNFEKYASGLSKKSKYNLDYSKYTNDLKGVIDANLDGIFVDPTDERFEASEIQKLRTLEQQRLRKEGLIKTTESLVGVEARLDRIKELSDKADNTASPKESQDLTNAILLEILATQNEIIKIFSTLGQAEMASGFINYSKDEHKKALAEKVLIEKEYTYRKWHSKCRAFAATYGKADASFYGRDCYWKAMRKHEEKWKKNNPIDYATQDGL